MTGEGAGRHISADGAAWVDRLLTGATPVAIGEGLVLPLYGDERVIGGRWVHAPGRALPDADEPGRFGLSVEAVLLGDREVRLTLTRREPGGLPFTTEEIRIPRSALLAVRATLELAGLVVDALDALPPGERLPWPIALAGQRPENRAESSGG